MADLKGGGTESDRIFDRLFTWGVVIGSITLVRSAFRGKKIKKEPLPPQGTPEFESLVRQGIAETILYLIGFIVAFILTFWDSIKKLFGH